MKIGIDARLIYQTGVGRYITNLLKEIEAIDSKNEYVIFLGDDAFDTYEVPNARWKKVRVNVRWHTVGEQLFLPRLFRRHQCDLVHIPYFNIPVFCSIPMVVTIHDLTVLTHPTGKATRLPKLLYGLKYSAYRLVLWVGLRKAVSVITVSQTTKQDIVRRYPFCKDKTTVTYEGVNLDHTERVNSVRSVQPFEKKSYFLYVGNAYPHKNLSILLDAIAATKSEGKDPGTFVFVGPEDYFYSKLQHEAKQKNLGDAIVFFGKATQEELVWLYSHAHALVFPSRSEGFGLPAIEAISCGCPVICSDIRVFHELLGNNATYVDPLDADAWSKALMYAQVHPKSHVRMKTDVYSWESMAKETLHVYERSVRL